MTGPLILYTLLIVAASLLGGFIPIQIDTSAEGLMIGADPIADRPKELSAAARLTTTRSRASRWPRRRGMAEVRAYLTHLGLLS